jgi:uncharacterized protein YcbX
MSETTLSEIIIYPIKSLGGIALEEAVVEEKGLQYDRRWMLIDENNKFLSQREFPKMATFKVALAADGLKVSTGKNESVFVPFEGIHDELKVSVWTSKLKAGVCETTVNEWFSDTLQMNCRLVRMNENSERLVSPYYAVRKFQDTVSFADGYPVLLIGESSLDDLNSKLENPVSMNRFRPNLVVKNAAAFAEDKWKKIRIGESIFHLVKPCARCVMTTINQETGISDGKEPLKTLAAYRLVKRAGKSKINFGQNLIAENFGAKVRLGDAVEILETKK